MQGKICVPLFCEMCAIRPFHTFPNFMTCEVEAARQDDNITIANVEGMASITNCPNTALSEPFQTVSISVCVCACVYMCLCAWHLSPKYLSFGQARLQATPEHFKLDEQGPVTLSVDLGEQARVSAIVLDFECAPSAFVLQISSNDGRWTEVYGHRFQRLAACESGFAKESSPLDGKPNRCSVLKPNTRLGFHVKQRCLCTARSVGSINNYGCPPRQP